VLQNISIGYRQLKITLVSAQKSLIDRSLPKIQSNLISTARLVA